MFYFTLLNSDRLFDGYRWDEDEDSIWLSMKN